MLTPATLELTPGPTGLTYISHKQPEGNQKLALTRQPKSNQNEMMWWTMKILSSHCLTKFFRVLNLRKTSIIYTLSSFEETSDISKLEQFHISDIYLDCKGAKVLHITAWMQIRCAQSQGCICLISLSYTLK